jgi:hypothetical protein
MEIRGEGPACPAAQPSTMTCTICAQSTLPGSMLCRACKAALKRARNLTVQEQPRPSQHRGPRPRRHATEPSRAARPPAPLPPGPLPAPQRRPVWRDLAVAAATLVLVGVAAYAGQGMFDGSDSAGAASGETEGALPAMVAPANVERVSPSRPAPSTGIVITMPPDAPALPNALAPEPPTASPLAGRTLVDPPRARATPKVEAAPMPPRVEDEVETAVDAIPTEPAPPPVRPAPPPDRWQSMQEALAACAREGGLAGIICDQRTRLARCEGYWGSVDACPLPPENPGGQ